MSHMNYARTSSQRSGLNTGQSVHSTDIGLRNRAMEAEYYRQRAEEAVQRRLKSRQKDEAKEARNQLIANDLRTMSKARVMEKHKVSYNTVANIEADMWIGKYPKPSEDEHIMKLAELHTGAD